MQQPVALKLVNANAVEAHRVSIDPRLRDELQPQASHTTPTIVVVRKAAILPAVSAGMIDAADVIAMSDGDWSNAILIVAPELEAATAHQSETKSAGDEKFLASVERSAPGLSGLASATVAAIRAAGVDGELVEGNGGRWVNRPLNTFTLKAQPRAGNLQFTLYGNPESYDAPGFLLQDQNSYSRGWVRGSDDAKRLAALALQSHARRRRSGQ